MEMYSIQATLRPTEIINVVRRSLSKIDPRLVDHGERVAYISKMIYMALADKADLDFSTLYILALLHDIGAYKTEEINDMVRFEVEKPFDHALFGYLFLKNTGNLSGSAAAILYHHTPYTVLRGMDCPAAQYAAILHLADRADILLHTPRGNLSVLRSMAGTTFSPADVDALFRAEEQYGFAEKVRSGAYFDDVKATVSTLSVNEKDVLGYLKLLVYAIDFRSPYTVTHTADTTLTALQLGRLTGLPEKTLSSLYMGAFLHDIGKIAIPHDILEKPGKLTPEEFTIVKGHIAEGEEILRGVVSDEICDIALRHHETLDGSGYPYGLRGDALTLPQRIVAVADIFSALTQERSYKPAFPKEKTVAILTEMKEAGRLCPRVVDTVCENYDRILAETEHSLNPVRHTYSDLLAEYAARSAALVTT